VEQYRSGLQEDIRSEGLNLCDVEVIAREEVAETCKVNETCIQYQKESRREHTIDDAFFDGDMELLKLSCMRVRIHPCKLVLKAQRVVHTSTLVPLEKEDAVF